MALTIPEREAVKILNREAARRGGYDGLQVFARNVLGAHSEQAKRLVTATENLRKYPLEDIVFPDEAKEYSVELSEDGGRYQGPITTVEHLASAMGLDPDEWDVRKGAGSAWGKVGDQQISVKAEFERKDYNILQRLDRDSLIEEMAQYAPEYEPIERDEFMDDPMLLEVVVSDLHFDALARGYSMEEAAQRVLEAVDAIIVQTDGYPVAKIALVMLGDTFNWDANFATTAGTFQFPVAIGPEVFQELRRVTVKAIDKLRILAPVEVFIIRGNHDYEKSAYFADTLFSWYHNDQEVVVFNDFQDRYYLNWGPAVIGLTHGKEEKRTDLPLIMLREADTTGCNVFEWHLGHYHTRRVDEIGGVVLRQFGSPAEDSSYEIKKGYIAHQKKIVGLLWSMRNGQIAEFPVQFVD